MLTTSTYITIMAVLIIFSAFFSATETAFSSLNKTKIKTLVEKGNRRAKLTCKLYEQYDKLISTILIGNNIVNIATASIGTVIFVKIYGDIGATISTVVITIVVLIFGEITPKSIAKDCPEKFAMFSAPFINLLILLLIPLNFLFSIWKKFVSKLLKLESNSKMSQEELLMLVDEVQQDGSIDKNEGELLKNAIEFAGQEAGDILTHRVDIKAVSVDTPKEDLAKVFFQSGFSRILIYEENIDNIIGVIHQKDFYYNGEISKMEIRELISPVVFVLENEKISNILRRLQTNKVHVAVVLDEYGGTYGMVTMEDVLEELVGEIWDEHDEVHESFWEINPGVYHVDASVDVESFCNYFEVQVDSEMASLGGFVMEQFGHSLKIGDSITYENLKISVTSMERQRVSEVEVCRVDMN